MDSLIFRALIFGTTGSVAGLLLPLFVGVIYVSTGGDKTGAGGIGMMAIISVPAGIVLGIFYALFTQKNQDPNKYNNETTISNDFNKIKNTWLASFCVVGIAQAIPFLSVNSTISKTIFYILLACTLIIGSKAFKNGYNLQQCFILGVSCKATHVVSYWTTNIIFGGALLGFSTIHFFKYLIIFGIAALIGGYTYNKLRQHRPSGWTR